MATITFSKKTMKHNAMKDKTEANNYTVDQLEMYFRIEIFNP